MSHSPNALDRIDDLTPTDLWSDIEHRRAGPEPEPPVSPSRRITVIAVAFLIAAVAIAIPIVVIQQTPDPIPFQTQVGRHGASRNPMGIPISVTYPPEWYAHNVLQPASLDDSVDGGRQVGLVISNTQGAMPTVSLESGSADGAGPLPDDPNLPPTFVTVTILTDEGRPVSVEDSSLPLSMDDGKVATGPANIRGLDVQIGGVPLTIEVQGGPQASEADLAAAEEIVASIRPDGVSNGFGFAPTSGWYEIATDDLAAGDAANVAWASTVPFTEEDLSFANESDGVLGRWTEPRQTIDGLSADETVIVVLASTYGGTYPAQPNVNFPAAESIKLPASPEFLTEWEGHGDTGVSRVTALATVNGWGVEVHAFFGTDDPSDAVVDGVNAQLGGFVLPSLDGETTSPPPVGRVGVSTTYVLSDFEIRFPWKPGHDQAAGVSYGTSWVTPHYPGEGDCVVNLLGRSGEVVGRKEFSLLTEEAESIVPFERLSVSGEPVSASGWCGGDPRAPSNFGQGYTFADPQVEDSTQIEGVEVTFTVSWLGSESPGARTCTLKVFLTDGSVREVSGGITIGEPERPTTFLVKGVASQDVASASVSCHPPNG